MKIFLCITLSCITVTIVGSDTAYATRFLYPSAPQFLYPSATQQQTIISVPHYNYPLSSSDNWKTLGHVAAEASHMHLLKCNTYMGWILLGYCKDTVPGL